MINGIGTSTASLLGTAGGSAKAGEATARAAVARPGNASATTIIRQMADDGPPVEMDRVAALKAAIRAGTYRADPQAIAAKMIDADLGGRAA